MGVWKINIAKNMTAKIDNTISILDIIDEERKYAVLSRRDSSSSMWRHYLLEMEEIHADIKNSIKKLRNSIDMQERKNLIYKLEKIGKNYLKADFLNDRNWVESFVKKEQVILKWLITMALYASEDGNTRINILDMEICDSVFFDLSMKNFTLKRMQEYTKEYKRFSIPIWSGYQNLCLEEPRQSIKFLKRGKFSKMGYKTMIFPLAGVEIENLMKHCKEVTSGVEKKICTLYNSGFKYILEKIKDKDVSLEGRYQTMFRDFFEKCSKDNMDNSLPKEIEKRDCDLIVEALEVKRDGNEELREKADMIWEKTMTIHLCKLKIYLEEYIDCVNMNELFDKYCKNNSTYYNLKKYVMQHSKFPINEVQIDDLYYCFFCEMLDFILYAQRREYIDKLFDTNIELDSIMII